MAVAFPFKRSNAVKNYWNENRQTMLKSKKNLSWQRIGIVKYLLDKMAYIYDR